jgi:hypothetical protein
MEQKMALVHQRLALLDSGSDEDADVAPAAASVRPFSLSSAQIITSHCSSLSGVSCTVAFPKLDNTYYVELLLIH